jgi:hypothetical protein
MSRTHREREDVWVVMRADLFHGPDAPLETLVTAKEVVRSEDLARREVERLSANAPERVLYWYTHSGLFPAGSSAGSRDDAVSNDDTAG